MNQCDCVTTSFPTKKSAVSPLGMVTLFLCGSAFAITTMAFLQARDLGGYVKHSSALSVEGGAGFALNFPLMLLNLGCVILTFLSLVSLASYFWVDRPALLRPLGFVSLLCWLPSCIWTFLVVKHLMRVAMT